MILLKNRQFFKLHKLLDENENTFKLQLDHLIYFEKGLETLLFEENDDILFKLYQESVGEKLVQLLKKAFNERQQSESELDLIKLIFKIEILLNYDSVKS